MISSDNSNNNLNKITDKLAHAENEESYVKQVNDLLFEIIDLQHSHLKYLHELLKRVAKSNL